MDLDSYKGDHKGLHLSKNAVYAKKHKILTGITQESCGPCPMMNEINKMNNPWIPMIQLLF